MSKEVLTEAKFLEKIFLSLLGGKKKEIESGLKNINPTARKELKKAFDELEGSMEKVQAIARKYGAKV